MNPIAKTITAAGFAIALIAFASAVLGANRSVAIYAFAIGFILVALGIILGILLMSPERFGGISPIGMKVSAIGFGIAAIPTAIGGFFFHKTDNDLAIFFWPGFALVVIGIVLHGWAIITKRS